jgi:hypothetical protein
MLQNIIVNKKIKYVHNDIELPMDGSIPKLENDIKSTRIGFTCKSVTPTI